MLAGSLILKPRFCYCFSPLFFQFVKQLSVKFWDVDNVEHRQRSIVLSIKPAQSSNYFIGNTVYRKLHLLTILLLVIVFFILGHCISVCSQAQKQILSYHSTVSTPKTQMEKFRFVMVLSILVSAVYYTLLQASYDW